MKYIVKINYGYGDEYHEVNADDTEHAEEIAYEIWLENAQSEAVHEVIGESTPKLREEYLD